MSPPAKDAVGQWVEADESASGLGAQLSLGQLTRRALGWSFVNNFVGRIGSVLVGIVLARILVPEDYGVYGVALVALNVMLSMNELGVSLAIVRWPGDVRRIAPTVTTLATAFSSALMIVVILIAPYVCSLLNAPRATGVLRLLTIAVLIDALSSVPAAFMTREFLQERRLIADTVGLVTSSSVSIALALLGHGVWSLALGQIVGNVLNAALIIWWAPYRLHFGYRRDIARELLVFGLPLAAASLMVFAMLNLDYVVVGSMLGPVSLGLYLLAFNLSGWPVNLLSAPVRRVSLAAFSRMNEDPARASRAFVRAFTVLLAAALPACLLMSVFAQSLVAFLYGDKWLSCAPVLPFLMVLALARVLAELAYDYLVALGRSRPTFFLQSLWFVVLVPSLIVGAHVRGIVGVGMAHAIAALAVVAPAYGLVLRRTGVRLSTIGACAARPVIGLVVAGGVAVAVRQLVPDGLLQLVIGGIVVTAAYLAVVSPMRRLLVESTAEFDVMA